jgi:hypothetical protein
MYKKNGRPRATAKKDTGKPTKASKTTTKTTTKKTTLPLSGSEPTCKYNVFSTQRGIQNNNCTAYAYQLARKDGTYFKLQPGDVSTRKPFHLRTCQQVVQRVKEDLQVLGGFPTRLTTPCHKNMYKIALVLAPNRDYHFLLQHKDVYYVTESNETRASIAKKFQVALADVQRKTSYARGTSVLVKNAGVWSHKRGIALPPTLLDAKGKLIKNPQMANFDYGHLNYSVFCGVFCVAKNKGTSPSVIKNNRNKNMIVANIDGPLTSGRFATRHPRLARQ